MSHAERGFDPVYTLLRNLTSPVVAITTAAGGRQNGFIVNSAQRASLVPTIPRISIYVSKTNFSHDLIYASGVFVLHLLRTDQWDLIWQLGLQSGRDVRKLEALQTSLGKTGAPVLADCIAAFECRVVNAMDTGASTFFLGDVENTVDGNHGDIMTSEHFRTFMPADKKLIYEENLRSAQTELEELTRNIDTKKIWPGPTITP